MSSSRLIPVLKNTVFKVYIPKPLILMTNRRYSNTTSCQVDNRRKSLLSYYETGRRHFSSKAASEKTKPVALDDETLTVRIAKKIPFFNINKYRMNIVGLVLYESIADRIPYMTFMEEFSLPDTFYSWFCVTELHVWLLSVRCMSEGEDGRLARNRLIEAMWADVGQRVKKLGSGNSPIIREQVKELSEQFQAALMGYDEGLLTDDVTLAGALWRRMFQMKEVDLDHLESFVRYIRKQIIYLDNIPSKELLSNKSLPWDFDRSK